MNETTVFNEIITHQIEGISFYNDLANLFDFYALRGYKRLFEYSALREFAEMRSTERYVINHLSKLPDTSNMQKPRDITSSWRNATRKEVSESNRKSQVRDLMTKWCDWLKEEKSLYERKFRELCNEGSIACANKVNEMVKKADCDLKYAERMWLDLSALDYDMLYIIGLQDDLHDCYEKKTEEHIKIEIS